MPKRRGSLASLFSTSPILNRQSHNVSLEMALYEPYKTDAKGNLETISLIGDEDTGAAHRGTTIARARNFARDLVNAPADDIYPRVADAALNLASKDLTVDVWGVDKLESENMVGTLAVGRGSSRTQIHSHALHPSQ